MRKVVTSVIAILVAAGLFAAEPYDEKLEYVESTGTQWIDTGLKLHYRYSHAVLNFRVIEAPATTAAFCGMCEPGADITSRGRSFVFRVDQPTSGKYRFLGSMTGSEGGAYRFPDDGTGTADYNKAWELDNYHTYKSFTGANAGLTGTNICVKFNGTEKGGYYHTDGYAYFTSTVNYYIGAANYRGTGLATAEGSLPKMQWYGARFYTNDELVGDFIPVKKNGVAGFYDNISKQFFPSQGQDPWVAPTTVTWSGEGEAGVLSDGNNWVGGAAPSTIHQVAVIPDGKSIDVTVATGTAFFNPLGGVRLAGADSRLRLSDYTVSSTWGTAIGGNGTVVFENLPSRSNGLSCFGNFDNFYGELYLSNLWYCVKHNGALGMSGRSKAYYYNSGSVGRFEIYSGNSGHGEVHVLDDGQFMFENGGSMSDHNDYFFDKNSVGVHGNVNADWTLYGGITGRSDANTTFNPYSGNSVRFSGVEKNFNLMLLLPQMNACYINCPIHTMARAKNADGAGQNQCNIRLDNGKKLYFGYENALDTNCFLQVGYAENVSAHKSNLVDLRGYDQRLGTLGVWSNGFDGNTVWNTNLVLTSATPATLTIYGQLRTDTGSTSKHVFPGRVRGAASVALDSKTEVMAEAWNWSDATVPGQIRFNCPGSDTTGGLSVNRGTMEILPTATFSNLTALAVSGTGVMKVGISGVGAEEDKLTVAIDSVDASLELAEGTSNACQTCRIPDGTYLDPGVYSGTEQEGAICTPYLKGEGLLEVKFTPWLGWPEAGTKTAVSIPAETAVTIFDEDVEKVAAISSIRCETEVTITIATTNETLFLNAAISGTPVITVDADSAPVVLNGDNSGILAPGGFTFNGSKCVVSNEFGLGSSASATALFRFHGNTFNANFSQLVFGAENGYMTNSAPIKIQALDSGDKNIRFGSCNSDEHFYQNANFTLAIQSGVCFPYFTYNSMLIGGKAVSSYTTRPYHTGVNTDEWGFGGTVEADFGHDQIWYSGYARIGGKSFKAEGMLATDAERRVTFMNDCVLTTNTVISGHANGVGEGWFIDFNGTSQEVARISQNNYGHNNRMNYGSTEPAMLKTISPTVQNKEVGLAFRGQLGYWHATAQNLTFSYSKSTSTGELIVSAGSVTFTNAPTAKWDTGWSGPVTVKAGGTLRFFSPASMTGSTGKPFYGDRVLKVEEGGSLEIGEGVTLEVDRALIGRTWLAKEKTYTVAEINALLGANPTVTITGTGSIRTSRERGFRFIVR